MKLDAEKTKQLIEGTNRNISQFCRDTGIKKYNMSKYMHGANIPKAALQRIADELGVDAFDLMVLKGFY